MEKRWIWPFELLDKLGEGGMGVVYRARYVGNNRIVAVKLVPDDVAANPTLLARFERELDVLKQLRHPHIVHCFGGTCESKQRFYAMEIVDGGTLHSLLRDVGKLPWETTVEYGLQMCAALECAHEQNVIHRDVKPGNFLITKSGKLKLSDFGLAIVVASQRITAAGKTMGTFHYMAPEQIRGKPPVTNRTDLYALGCVLYEMLTGNPPFDADHAAEVLHQHLKEPAPRVSQSVTNCPFQLDQLVADLLQKDPELRPATAGVVAERLKGIGQSPAATAVSFTPTPAAIRSLVPEDNPFSAAPVAIRPRLLAWPFWTAMTLLILVLSWGLVLRSHNRSLQQRVSRSEQMWVELFQKGGDELKLAAVKAFGKMDSLHPDTFEFLMSQLSAPNRNVRLATVQSLIDHPDRAKAAKSKLITMRGQDEDEPIRRKVEEAIAKIPEAKDKPPEKTSFFGWALPLFACLVFAAFFYYLWLWWTGHPATTSA